MKHLKSKKIFESITPDNIQDIKDILAEVGDMNYDIDVSEGSNGFYRIEVVLKGRGTKDNMIRWSELKDYAERVFEYLGNVMLVNIMDIHLYMNQHVSYIHDTDLNYPVYSISIIFEP